MTGTSRYMQILNPSEQKNELYTEHLPPFVKLNILRIHFTQIYCLF